MGYVVKIELSTAEFHSVEAALSRAKEVVEGLRERDQEHLIDSLKIVDPSDVYIE